MMRCTAEPGVLHIAQPYGHTAIYKRAPKRLSLCCISRSRRHEPAPSHYEMARDFGVLIPAMA